MEYVEGETVRDRLRKGPLGADEVLSATTQIAAGLEEAHGKGIIHPRHQEHQHHGYRPGPGQGHGFRAGEGPGGSSLTRTQTTLGTVAYMSPEQAGGKEVDHRTDLWSVGVVLYELLTGELPFQGDHRPP